MSIAFLLHDVQREMPRGFAVLPGLLAIALLWPLMGAGYFTDDWTWLVLARHLESPWPMFHQQMLFDYFYRPLPFLSWWLGERVFGIEPMGQYAINMTFHAANATLLSAVLLRWTHNWRAALLGGLVFAALPATQVTAFWLSNRNELMATTFGLSALWFAASPVGGRAELLGSALASMLALGCKESAVVYVALAALWWLLRESHWRHKALTAVVFVLIALGYAAIRLSVLTGPDALPDGDFATRLITGIRSWIQVWPEAMAGFGSAWISRAAWVLLLLIGILAWISAWMRGSAQSEGRVFLACLWLLLSPASILWPVTSMILVHESATQFLVNERFFYGTGIGLASCAAIGWQALLSPRVRILVAAGIGGVVMYSGMNSMSMSRDWADESNRHTQQVRTLAYAILNTPIQPACLVVFDQTQLPLALTGFSDFAVKSFAPRHHPIGQCAIMGAGEPFFVVLSNQNCSPMQFAPARVESYAGRLIHQAYSNLCLLRVDRETLPTNHPRLVFLHVPTQP